MKRVILGALLLLTVANAHWEYYNRCWMQRVPVKYYDINGLHIEYHIRKVCKQHKRWVRDPKPRYNNSYRGY